MSLASTVAAFSVSAGLAGPFAGSVILLLAYLKARVVLAQYLGLSAAPFWYRGFKLVIGGYMLLLLSLYVIPNL
ncbi:hypothetical protein [Pelagibius sp. Alg239-R121]|uniref:hypothetical protein n=1 Tax=Pelagibius sp. Alg239-R121 TaxID=2993448 RepID=UPI0024A68F8C|nr:hypothetical protein [Pelagibius sp. Alg239-R121]